MRRADPSASDAPSTNIIAIQVSELMRDTLGILPEDPRIVEARAILELAHEFKAKYGSPGTFAAAGDLIALVNEWHQGIGSVNAVRHRFYSSVRNMNYDDPLDDKLTAQMIAAGSIGLLRGEAQYHEDVTTGFLGAPIARLFKEDSLFRSKGDDSLIARKIPRRNRQNRLSKLLEVGRGLSILRAHYDARRHGRSWLKSHQILLPGIGDETRRGWNKDVDRELRKIARMAGSKAAEQEPLNGDEQAIEAQVLRYTPDQFREGLASLTAAGGEKSS
jgi:hypothetical protein